MSAAAAPRFPRRYARSGSASKARNHHGWTKVRAVSLGSQFQLSGFKLSPLHEACGFLEQQFAVGGGCFVARELDQVAPIQEVTEQRSFVLGEGRRLRERFEKFYRCLPCHR